MNVLVYAKSLVVSDVHTKCDIHVNTPLLLSLAPPFLLAFLLSPFYAHTRDLRHLRYPNLCHFIVPPAIVRALQAFLAVTRRFRRTTVL
jgi:hypothetical protein